jgi:LacI family transcriptional regulator
VGRDSLIRTQAICYLPVELPGGGALEWTCPPKADSMATHLKRHIRRVALAFPNRSAHLHFILRGIVDYARERANWIFINGAASFDFPLVSLSSWDGDGIIAHMSTQSDADAAQTLKMPVVTFVGTLRNPGVPRVSMAQAAIGELAAEHLMMQGFTHFAFYGIQNVIYSEDRRAAFTRVLAGAGFSPLIHLSQTVFGKQQQSWDEELLDLSKWISSLPKPIGIFAANDQRARMIADASHMAGARIPEHVGIVGVDNDEISCELGSPTLTSVAFDWHSLGYETAALLDRLMDGKKAPVQDKIIAPIGLIARESTSAVISSDPHVAKAIGFISRHLSLPFGVQALVDATGVSRRHLELAFRKSLGCSPMVFLARFRVERAKSLLQQRGLSLTSISKRCGFADLRHFRRTFSRVTQLTPREYQASIKSIFRR